jgi:hypothetical protein
MSLVKKEEIVKEQRTMEAMRKKLMGSEGKFVCIARFLGHPIISHSSLIDVKELDDFWELEEEEMPIIDENTITRNIGWIFDGLTFGVNLEIQYLDDFKEIKVNYDGKIVYKEVGGNLELYAPENVWEKRVDEFFIVAQKKEKNNRKQKETEIKEIVRKKQNLILEKLKQRWNI